MFGCFVRHALNKRKVIFFVVDVVKWILFFV